MDASKLVVLLILTVICTIFAFFVKNRPRYFLFLMVLFAPLAPALIFRHLNGIYLMDVPLAILLSYGLLSDRRFRVYAGLPVFGLILWSLISALFAVRIDMALIELTRTIRAYLAFLCVANFTKSKKDIYAVLVALLISFTFESILGFLQWRRGYLGLTFLWEPRFGWRSRGTFIHPNFLADHLILLLPMVLRLFAFYKHDKRLYNAVFCLLFSVGFGALMGAFSRGAWLSFAGSMIIMLLYSLFRRRYHPKLISAIAFLVLLGTVFSVHYSEKILSQYGEKSGRSGSMNIRFPLNEIALRIIKDNLVLGVGLNNYEEISYKYVSHEEETDLIPYEQLLQVVHNSHLLIMAENGIPGFLFYVWFLIYLFNKGRIVLKLKHAFFSNIGLGILTGYLAILATFLTGPDYYNHQIMMLIWILGGFLVTISKIKIATPKPIPRKRQIRNAIPIGHFT